MPARPDSFAFVDAPACAVSARFGVTETPTHIPIRNGVAAPPRVPSGDQLAAAHLARADQRCGPLELLRGQQPQRVAHQHRDPVGAIAAATSPCSRRIANVYAVRPR